MVTELQFVAVAAYLLWCLFSSLTGVQGADRDTDDPAAIDESDEINKFTTAG